MSVNIQIDNAETRWATGLSVPSLGFKIGVYTHINTYELVHQVNHKQMIHQIIGFPSPKKNPYVNRSIQIYKNPFSPKFQLINACKEEQKSTHITVRKMKILSQ